MRERLLIVVGILVGACGGSAAPDAPPSDGSASPDASPAADAPGAPGSDATLSDGPPGAVDAQGDAPRDASPPDGAIADASIADAVELLPDGPSAHPLEVVVSGAGRVVSAPDGIDCPGACAAWFPAGSAAFLYATPEPGAELLGWSGDCSGTGACGLYMATARTVTATFTPSRLLTVAVAGSGRVVSSPPGIDCGPTCTATYVDGTGVSLSQQGFSSLFSGWSGACTGSGTCSVTMTGDLSVGAAFLPDGTHLWSRGLADPGGSLLGVDVGVDSAGQLFIAGTGHGPVDLGCGVLSSYADTYDLLVAKLASDGTCIWSRMYSGDGFELPSNLVVDGLGDVIVIGRFDSTINYGGGELTAVGAHDGFIVKLAGGDGSHLWSRAIVDSGWQEPEGVAVDDSGDVFVTGKLDGSGNLGGSPIVGSQGYLARYASTDGALVWARVYGTATWCSDVDARGGSLVLTGMASSPDLGAGPTPTVDTDPFVAKLSAATGEPVWIRTFAATSDLGAVDEVALLADGRIFVSGYFATQIDVGGHVLTTTAGTWAEWAAALGADGVPTWARTVGSSASDYVRDVAADATGDMLMVGSYGGLADFGGISVGSIGDPDIFVARLSGTDGTGLYAAGFGVAAGTDGGRGIVGRADGTLVIVGSTTSPGADFGGGPLAPRPVEYAFVVALDP